MESTEKPKRNTRKQPFKLDISVIFALYLIFSVFIFAAFFDTFSKYANKEQLFNQEFVKELNIKIDSLQKSIDDMNNEFINIKTVIMFQSEINDKTEDLLKKQETNLQYMNRKLKKLEFSVEQLTN